MGHGQKLSALVNHTDAGFLVFDTQLQVRWMNNVCRDWLGTRETMPRQLVRCCDVMCGARRVAEPLAIEAASQERGGRRGSRRRRPFGRW